MRLSFYLDIGGSDLDIGAGAMVFWMGFIYLFSAIHRLRLDRVEGMKHLGADDMTPFSLRQYHNVADWIRDDSEPKYIRTYGWI